MDLKDATILVVEDEGALLKIFVRWLEREGARVFGAQNGLEALERLEIDAVDMIVSDVRMPKMDGIELATRVRNTGRYYPKIIFVSGFGAIGERECCDLGIEFKLAKPIRRENLVSAVQMCLTSREHLWHGPSAPTPAKTLDAVFPDLRGAQDQGEIAFGYGGFCVRSELSVQAGELIGLNLVFTADAHAIAGQGVVRWAVRDEQTIGVMILYLDASHRQWLVDLPERRRAVSFIPRSSDAVASNAPVAVRPEPWP